MIHDWNMLGRDEPIIPPGFQLVDETLRDGIQSASVRNPPIETKVELLRMMAGNGIDVANVGLPGAGAAAVSDCVRLVRAIRSEELNIAPNCAARTHPNDIRAIAEVSQAAGVEVECCAFLGSSPVRRMVEGWSLEKMTSLVADAGDLCRRENLPFSFVTEDTTRANPDTLRLLFRTAIDHGASRFVLCDTCGHATPFGVQALVTFTRGVIAEAGAEDIQLDWHGHNDRGLALPNALEALEIKVNRVHGTCLGIGERVGNAPIDQLIVNLVLLGAIERNLEQLSAYVEAVSREYEVPIPATYPVFGEDAFRTATGVHASAIVKALAAGRRDLADKVYSSVPAADFGREQRIDVGYYSGRANVECWLHLNGEKATPERIAAILRVAKSGRRTLTDAEIREAMNGADA